MKPCQFTSHPWRKQTGDFLIESLIGMVLMGIIGMGITFVTSRVSSSQQEMRVQEAAVSQMRAALLRNRMGAIDVCDPANPPRVLLPPDNRIIVLEVRGCGTDTAEINGVQVAGIPRQILLSAVLDPPIGQIVVGGTWR